MAKQFNNIKILFVCLGNICRSPLAEYILRDMVTKRGDSAGFYIASAATSTEEIGNPVITLNMIICWEWKNAILSI